MFASYNKATTEKRQLRFRGAAANFLNNVTSMIT